MVGAAKPPSPTGVPGASAGAHSQLSGTEQDADGNAEGTWGAATTSRLTEKRNSAVIGAANFRRPYSAGVSRPGRAHGY